MRTLRLAAGAFVAILLVACQGDEAATGGVEPTLPTGFWHARITLPGGDIEAGIELSHGADGYGASLVNGQERVPINEVLFENGELLLRFPAFNNEIRARLDDGQLVGELVLVKRHGATQSMPFVATPGAERKPESTGNSSEHDLSGRWSATFHEPDGSNAAAIGEFQQRGARLFGTFLHPNGDYRYLAGYVRGDEFKLSTFDGAHAFIFTGNVEDGRIVNGQFWSGTSWHQTWTAERNAEAKLPDAYSRTWLKPGYERFTFEFPDPDGNPVSIDDPRFDGKVVVVTLAGTWCPNCHDEARFMAPLYDEYRDKGLEVVALMFEHFEDHDVAAARIRDFREKFDIDYATLIAGVSSKTEAADVLPSLNAVLAFPTTIFIDRQGKVRRIHTGFSGPGTGAHYEELTAEITAFIDELLAEPAATAGSAASGG